MTTTPCLGRTREILERSLFTKSVFSREHKQKHWNFNPKYKLCLQPKNTDTTEERDSNRESLPRCSWTWETGKTTRPRPPKDSVDVQGRSLCTRLHRHNIQSGRVCVPGQTTVRKIEESTRHHSLSFTFVCVYVYLYTPY